MLSKSTEKGRAIKLRKSGLSYNEILKIIPVAKSSLSLWLKDLPLTQKEKRYLKSRKDNNISRGRIKAASELMGRRIEREKDHVFEAKNLFEKHKHDPLFLIGVALYWAEGTKRSSIFQFINSDHSMNKFMFLWIQKYMQIPKEKIGLRLYGHKIYEHEDCEVFWAKVLGVEISQFSKTVYKPSRLMIKKRPNYKGCLRLQPEGGVKLIRYIRTWQECLIDYVMK